MEVVPAIDLMNSQVVRLRQGKPSEVNYYAAGRTPLEIAERWQQEGARNLHIIDLNRTLGTGSNSAIVRSIVDSLEMRIQVGGGLRSADEIIELLSHSLVTVMLGTLAFHDQRTLRMLLSEYGADRIMVALDYRDEMVMMKGWKQSTGITLRDAFENLLEMGVERFLLTAIDRDGMLNGPDLQTLSDLCRRDESTISAAGGIGTLEDIRLLAKSGVSAAVVGKAFYDRAFTLTDALQAVMEVSG